MLTLGITVILSYGLYDKMLSTGSLNSTAASVAIGNTILPQWGVWDNIFLAAIIGLSITSIIAAANVRTSPLFFFISLVLYTIVLIVGYIMQTTFTSLNSQGFIQTYSAAFPKINFIMNNLVLILMVVGTMITIAIYSTRGTDGLG